MHWFSSLGGTVHVQHHGHDGNCNEASWEEPDRVNNMAMNGKTADQMKTSSAEGHRAWRLLKNALHNVHGALQSGWRVQNYSSCVPQPWWIIFVRASRPLFPEESGSTISHFFENDPRFRVNVKLSMQSIVLSKRSCRSDFHPFARAPGRSYSFSFFFFFLSLSTSFFAFSAFLIRFFSSFHISADSSSSSGDNL